MDENTDRAKDTATENIRTRVDKLWGFEITWGFRIIEIRAQ